MLRGFLVITGALAVADGILRRTLSPIPPGTLSPIPPSRRRSLRVPRMDEDSDSLLSTLPGPVSSSAMDEATAEDYHASLADFARRHRHRDVHLSVEQDFTLDGWDDDERLLAIRRPLGAPGRLVFRGNELTPDVVLADAGVRLSLIHI